MMEKGEKLVKDRGPEWVSARLDEWRSQGIRVIALEELITSGTPIAKVIQKVEEFEKEVRALRMLGEALKDLDTVGFEEDVKRIETMLDDVDRISDIEVAILKLQFKIERKKKADQMRSEQELAEREEFRTKLHGWRSAGYDVWSLEEVLERGALAEIEIAFNGFERFVTESAGYLKELDNYRGTGNDEEVQKIENLLRDPSGLAEAEERLLRLKLTVERQRRSETVEMKERAGLKKRMGRILDQWAQEGFDVSELRKAVDADPEAARGPIEKARMDIDRLRILKEELRALEGQGMDEEVAIIGAKFTDIGKITEIEEDILGLQLLVERKRQEERRRKNREIAYRRDVATKIEAWMKDGMDVSRVVKALEGDFDTLRTEVAAFEERHDALRLLSEELDSMAAQEGADKAAIADVRRRMATAETLKPFEDEVLALKVSIEKARREVGRREEISEAIAKWEQEGYDVSDLYRRMKDDNLRNLERALVSFRIGVHTLKELRTELDALAKQRPDMDMRISDIRSKLKSVAMIPDAEKALFDLKRELEKAEDEERRTRMKELRERAEIAERITILAPGHLKEGMMDKLEEVLAKGGDIEETKTKYKDLEGQLERANALMEKMKKVDTTGFEAAVEEIRIRIKNLENLDDVEVTIDDLLQRISRRREDEDRKRDDERRRKDGFKEQLNRWRREGFKVDRLDSLMEKDLATIRGQFIVYRIRIQRLKEIMKDVQVLPDDMFWEDKAAILAIIDDVERISEVETRLARLRARASEVEEERLKRAEYKQKMEEWKVAGYDVRRLESILDKDMDILAKEFLVFKIRLQKLEDLREELNVLALGAQEFQDEVARIRAMLRDVDKITDIREAITAIKDKISERRQQEKSKDLQEAEAREEMLAQLAEWATEGYDVEHLVPLFDSGVDLRAAFKTFEEMVERREILERRLEYLDTEGFEGEVAFIRSNLNSFDKIREAEEDVAILEDKIRKRALAGKRRAEDEGKLRADMLRQIEAWEAEGYDVAALQVLADSPNVEDLGKALIVFRIRTERLKELETNLRRMDVKGSEARRDVLLSKMKDIDHIDELENEMASLVRDMRDKRMVEERHRSEEKREREAYAAKMMDWISHGYNVKPLEEVIEKDIETIRRTFNSFEWAIEELKAYEAILNDLELRGFVKEVVDLRSNIMNVDSLPLIRSRMSALRERLGPDVVPIATVTTQTLQEVPGPKVPMAATMPMPEAPAAAQATDQEPLKTGKAGEPGPLMLSNLLDRIRSLRRTEGLQAVEGVERLREEGPLGPTAVPMAAGPGARVEKKKKVTQGEMEEAEGEWDGEEPEERGEKTEGGGEVSQKKKVKKKVKKKIRGRDDRGQ